MKEIIIEARSESMPGTCYEVSFAFQDDGNVSVYCECGAGEYGKLCKHKRELIFGNVDWLAKPKHVDKLKAALDLLAKTAEGATYIEIYETLAGIDREQEALKERRRGLVHKLERLMRE